MAYSAKLNGETFFRTDRMTDELTLTSTLLELQAGSSGAFRFTIPPQNRAYTDLDLLTGYVDVYRDTDLIFSGRIYAKQQLFNKQIYVTCEGLLSLLHDTIFRPITFDGALYDLVATILTQHNSQVEEEKKIRVGTLTVGNGVVYRAYENYDTCLSRLKDLQDGFGGFMAIRKETTGLYLDWTGFETGATQSIDFGENLLDVKVEENADDKVTRLIPLGATQEDGTRLTIKSVNSDLDYIEAAQTYIDRYGYVTAVEIWDDVNVASILLSKAQAYLTSLLTPKVTINVTAVDLADAGYAVDSFRVGMRLKVVSGAHGINDWFDCNKQNLDLLHPANNKLALGAAVSGYIESNRKQTNQEIKRISSTSVTKSVMDAAIASATSLITGASGGYVVIRDADDDGHPDEILIMDTADLSTAVNVWRFNQNGWGHSSTGYSGTYTLGATIDGGLVADFITAGVLNANLLKSGIIQGLAGGSSWNLVTGQLTIVGDGMTSIDGGSITTDSIKAASIDIANLFAQAITASNLTITGGSIQIETNADSDDIIALSHGQSSIKIRSAGFQKYVADVLRWNLIGGTFYGYDTSGNMTLVLSGAAGGDIRIGGQSVDVVVSETTSNGLTCRVWKSGKMEVFGTVTYDHVSITSQWGSSPIYEGFLGYITFPQAFAAAPAFVAQICGTSDGGCWLEVTGSVDASSSPRLWVCRADNNKTDVTIKIGVYAVGTKASS